MVGLNLTLLAKIRGLLFEDGTWRAALFKNIFWATGSEAAVRVIRILTLILLVRWLGPTEYGYYAYAFAFASMFSIAFDAGSSTAVARIISRKPTFIRFLPNIIAFKLLLVAGGLTLIAVAAFVSAPDSESRLVILIMGVFFAAQEILNLCYVMLRSLNRFRDEFVARFWYSVGAMVVVLLAVFFSPLGRVATFSQAVVAIAAGIVVLAIMSKGKLGGNWRRNNVRIGKILLLSALPLTLVNGASVLYTNIDTVLLGLFSSIQQAGLYSAATRLLYIAQLPTAIVGLVIFPTLAAGIKNKSPENRLKWAELMGGMTFVSIPVTMALVVCATDLVGLVFGGKYDQSGHILEIMAFGLPPLYVYPMFVQALIMIGRMRALIVASVGCATVVTVLFAILIKAFGSTGAAMGLVVTNYLLAVVFGVMVHASGHLDVVRPALTWRNAAAGLSVALAATTLLLLPALPTGFLRIAACLALFGTFYVAIAGVRSLVHGRARPEA